MNDVGKRIAEILDQGCRSLDTTTVAQLASMRRLALSNRKHSQVGQGLLAWTHDHPWRTMLLAATLLVAAWTGYSWQQPSDNSDVDILLLTDELPPQAYAEKDFNAWLKHSAR
jgi:hypothetical protein